MDLFQQLLGQMRTNRRATLIAHYSMRIAEITSMLVFGLAAVYASIAPHWNALPYLPFPLADPQGVIADSNGRVFVGLGFWGSVQVYDSMGRYLHRFRVDGGGGGFRMQLGNGEAIEILPNRRRERVFRYSKDGELLGSERTKQRTCIRCYRQSVGFTDALGRRYVLRNRVYWPEVERLEKDGQTSLTVRNPWYYAPIAGPVHIIIFATMLQICRWSF